MSMTLGTTGDDGADETVDSQAQAACVLYSVRPMYCTVLSYSLRKWCADEFATPACQLMAGEYCFSRHVCLT